MPQGAGKKWRKNPVRRRSPSPQWHQQQHEEKERYDKFTARFFKQAHEQRDDYMRQVERLAAVIARAGGIDHAAFNSRKELMWSRLRTFDKALTLFKEKRNFDDSERFEEHFGNVNKFPPKQRRNLTLAKFAQFYDRAKMIETKPPINVPRFDVSLVVAPHVDGYSSTRQLRLEIHSGRKDELLSGFLAIHHPNKKDTIHYIYLSDQKVLLFVDELIERGFVTASANWADLRMTLCINKYARSDGELAQLFLDDLRNNNRDLKAEIRQIETRQLTERIGQRTFDDGEIEREVEHQLMQEQIEKEHLQSPGSGSVSSGTSADKYNEQFTRVVDGESITNINTEMAYGIICNDDWKRPQRDPRRHYHDQHSTVLINLEQSQWPRDENWVDSWPPTRKRKVAEESTEPRAKAVKSEPVTEHYFQQQDMERFATLKANLAKEMKKLHRDEKTLEKWRCEWRKSVADYSDEAMIADNVEQEYQITNERGVKRISDRKKVVKQLENQIEGLKEELELYN